MIAVVLGAMAIAFGAVFVAELADKSQLMTLSFAARYRALPVLIGVAAASVAVSLISAAVGSGLAEVLPERWISIASGLVFIAVAIWMLRGDTESSSAVDDVSSPAAADGAGGGRQRRLAVILPVFATFFVSELGDKTMLVTMGLAGENGFVGTWLGAAAGMFAANLIAVVVGRQLGDRLPERAIRWATAGLFAVFGVVVLVGAFVRSG